MLAKIDEKQGYTQPFLAMLAKDSLLLHSMETMRQQKVSRLIMKELGDIFQREGVSLSKALVTITKVRLTRDLGIARVYLSIFGAKDKAAELEHLRSRTREIRFLLGRQVGSLMRIIPDLEFYEDDSLDYIDHIDKLLHR